MNQRTINENDMPKKEQRSPKQIYVLWAFESPAYLGTSSNKYGTIDIHKLNNYFNRTMTYRKDSDFHYAYGRIVKMKQHPPIGSLALAKIIDDYGKNNKHLARNRTDAKAAWFVSNCYTVSQRELLVKEIKKHITIDVSVINLIFSINYP